MNTAQSPKAIESNSSGLGVPKHTFPLKKQIRTGSLVVFFILLGCSALIFLNGLSITYQAYQKHGPAVIAGGLTVPGMAALVLFMAGLATGWWAYKNWNGGVFVYDEGFAVRRRKDMQLWRWENIVSLTAAATRPFLGRISNGTHIYRLVDRRDQRITLDDKYSRVEELATIIQAAIFPNLYARAAQKFNTGQRLGFGPVIISREAIQIGKRAVPWSDVRQISIRNGVLRVSRKEGNWLSGASAPAAAIPNLNVLLNIIHQVVGLKTE